VSLRNIPYKYIPEIYECNSSFKSCSFTFPLLTRYYQHFALRTRKQQDDDASDADSPTPSPLQDCCCHLQQRDRQGTSTHCVSTFFGVQNKELNVDGNGDASSSAFLEKNEFRTKPEEDKGR
jgi:hypothetical protein